MRQHLIKMVYRRSTDTTHVYRAETNGQIVRQVVVQKALMPRPAAEAQVSIAWEETKLVKEAR